MSPQPAFARCASCGFEPTELLARCPGCKRVFRTSAQVRVSGALLIVLGAALSIGMTYLLMVVANKMGHPGGNVSGSFTGSPRDAAFIFAILGGVLVFGLTSTLTGVWQVVAGRRNLLLSGIVLLLGLATVVVTVLFQLTP